MSEPKALIRHPDQVAFFITPPSESLSKSSANAYKSDREAYLKFCEERGIAIGDVSSLECYRDFLLEQSYKPASINRKLAAIKKGIYGYLIAVYGKEQAELIKPIYRSVKSVKQSKNEKAVRAEAILSEEEIARLVVAADPRTALLITFLFKTGTRISEVLNVALDDVAEKEDAVEVSVLGKGMKGRRVFLSKPDYQAIRETFQGEHFLFETGSHHRYDRTNVSKRIARLAESVLGKHISAHSLRHSFATAMIRKTNKIVATSEYLGHSSTTMTLDMYVHETFSLSELL